MISTFFLIIGLATLIKKRLPFLFCLFMNIIINSISFAVLILLFKDDFYNSELGYFQFNIFMAYFILSFWGLLLFRDKD